MKLPTVLQHWVGCDADELPEPDRAPHAEQERIYREQIQGHVIEAFCSSVSSSKNRCRVAALRPGAAHITRKCHGQPHMRRARAERIKQDRASKS
jgi:hypothetical protein